MLIVTIAALVMAASLGWYAFRLLQQEQRRSEARVALLTAALDQDAAEDAGALREAGESAAVLRVTQPRPGGTSTTDTPEHGAAWQAQHRDARPGPTVAPVPSVVALEGDARAMQAFASEQGGWAQGEAEETDVMRRVRLGAMPDHDAAAQVRSTGLFADVPEPRPADARGLFALGGLVLVGVLAVGYVGFSRSGTTEAAGASAPHAARPIAAGLASALPQGGVPLELLSLTPEQRGDTLVIRGRIRNPVSGSDRSGVVAHVLLLDHAGASLGAGRSALDPPLIRAGSDTGFVVTMRSHADMRRYRVTFRTEEDTLVPHADRRNGS
jgi:hypothetical protein